MTVYNRVAFGAQNLFSTTSRERCTTYFKKMPVIPKLETIKPKYKTAVLVAMCTIENVPSLIYSVRSPFMRSNSEVTSFPGGKMYPNDNPVQAALRETMEEIGLAPGRVEVWCHGPALPGKVEIVPVIGTVLDLKREDFNVKKLASEVIGVSIETLCDPKKQYYTQFKYGSILPVFIAEQYKILGVTAYITHCFLSALLPKDVYSNNWMMRKIVLKDT